MENRAPVGQGMGACEGSDQPNADLGGQEWHHGVQDIPHTDANPRILPSTTLPMRFFNKFKPLIEVEVITLDAKLRVGETKWDAVVYRRIDDGQIHCRPKAEFFAKFVLIARK
jgi:hypothetical protein